jgi:hypothetical protein
MYEEIVMMMLVESGCDDPTIIKPMQFLVDNTDYPYLHSIEEPQYEALYDSGFVHV